jgi:hypothetical protein
MKNLLKLTLSVVLIGIISLQYTNCQGVAESDKTSGTNNQQSVETSVLIACLPGALPEGFKKDELNINSTSPAEVNISYNKLIKKGSGGEDGSTNKYITVGITITDGTGNTEFTYDMIKAQRKEEKAIKVNGKYDGKESLEKNDYGCVESGKTFLVNNRFLVEIKASNVCDFVVIDQFISTMNLEHLPK